MYVDEHTFEKKRSLELKKNGVRSSDLPGPACMKYEELTLSVGHDIRRAEKKTSERPRRTRQNRYELYGLGYVRSPCTEILSLHDMDTI